MPLGVSCPSRAYFSILPRWLMEVAQSRTKGKSSLVGTPQVSGLVPRHGFTPKVGAMEGRALVPVRPTQPVQGNEDKNNESIYIQ